MIANTAEQGVPSPAEAPAKSRKGSRSLLIVESKCRQFMLDYAARTRAHKFTRVSMDAVTPELENALRDAMRKIVNRQPSMGKTIM